MKHYTVCLSFDRNFCETATAQVAERNNAIGYEIVPVGTRAQRVAYRGEIILQEDDNDTRN